MRVGVLSLGVVMAVASCAALTSFDDLRNDGGEADTAPNDVIGDARADVQRTSYRAIVMSDHPISYFRFGETLLEAGPVDEEGFVVGAYGAQTKLGVPGAIANDPNTAAAVVGGAQTIATFGSVFELAGKAPFTLEAWVRPTTTPNFAYVIDRLASGTSGWWLSCGSSGQAGYTRVNGDASTSVITAAPIALGVYSYLVVAFDGATATLYVNAAVAAVQTDVTLAPSNNAIVGIGNGWSGSLDEVAVYDHALTMAQVVAHYQVGTGIADF